jgi:CelD/BcsL family acetyltransferase involved in cellulose biosynthesis
METAELSLLTNFAVDSPKSMVVAARMDDLASQKSSGFDVVRFDELSDNDLAKWEELRSTQPEFRSPFFSSAFSRAVHAVRGDVLVAMLKQRCETVGFFPHHLIGSNAYPVGRKFNDAHGVIASPDTEFTWSELLKAIGAKGFEFHSLVGADRERMSPVSFAGTIGSFLTSLGEDSKASLKRREREHRTLLKQGQKTRKLAREVGELRLEVDCNSPSQMVAAIERKRDHYRRTNIFDLFSPPWTQELVRSLSVNRQDEARVMLSLLWAGDTVVASHIGFREGSLLHYWFPAYDTRYSKYSPGTALFIELVRCASEHGIEAIDMGFGEQPYKRKQTDVQSDVAFGYASDSGLRRTMYRAGLVRQQFVKSLPMKETLKYVLRRLHPRAGISDFS